MHCPTQIGMIWPVPAKRPPGVAIVLGHVRVVADPVVVDLVVADVAAGWRQEHEVCYAKPI